MEILFIPFYLAAGFFILIVWLVTAKRPSSQPKAASVQKPVAAVAVEPVFDPVFVEGQDGSIWEVQVVPGTGGKRIRRKNLSTGLVNHHDGDIEGAISQLLGQNSCPPMRRLVNQRALRA
jgi:hypothetical protein